jgi:Cu+-exporting ATPase
MEQLKKEHKLTCYHCGEACVDKSFHFNEKIFCCSGCKMVFEILNKNELCTYYNLTENPGINQKVQARSNKFSYLDDAEVQTKLIQYTDGNQTRVSFYLPQMHCSSCIWLLENLHKINSSILKSFVDFPKKEIIIVFQTAHFNLRKLVELLNNIGYEPHINLSDLETKKTNPINKARLFKVGIAGFCFGNIMMLSFPEYFSDGIYYEKGMKELFTYLILLLSLPVFFYSASEFYISAWKSLQKKILNIDAPIVVALLITFSRSVYEILSESGSGYLDSMSGIVFFMLVGRMFQDRVYNSLSFERDYKSYFPIAVTVIKNGKEENLPLSKLKIGDRILVRNQELIPADSILFYGKASIDYSFVTGESLPVEKSIGEIVYAGGKQIGASLEMEVVKEVSQSYLTQLWNNAVFHNEKSNNPSFIHLLSKHFTVALFTLAALVCLYWLYYDSSRIINALTAILIVACPCSLLLSATFTNGNNIRILSRNQLFLKNADVLEALATADTLVFDKTGTLTQNDISKLEYAGTNLSAFEEKLVVSLAIQSSHPLSKALCNHFENRKVFACTDFHEHVGKGTEANIEGYIIRLGSPQFILGKNLRLSDNTTICLEIENTFKGIFELKTQYRKGFEEMAFGFKKRYKLAVLSGDTPSEKIYLQNIFGPTAELKFCQSPEDKLNYVASLQAKGKKVIMVGDGLNDAGALKKSDVGIALSEKNNNFSPACDGLLDAKRFMDLLKFIDFAKTGKRIIIGSFILSLIYNIVGISYAAQGTLSPLIAAILMPASSVSILLFTVGLSTIAAKKADLL